MTAQEAYDFHRQRAFRDPEGEVEGIEWTDPIEVLAEFMQLVRWETPEAARAILDSESTRPQCSFRWVRYGPQGRQLYRKRAGVALVAAGIVQGGA